MDPRFADGPNAIEDPEDRVWLRTHMEEVIRSKPLAHWEQCMIENDCAFGILLWGAITHPYLVAARRLRSR